MKKIMIALFVLTLILAIAVHGSIVIGPGINSNTFTTISSKQYAAEYYTDRVQVEFNITQSYMCRFYSGFGVIAVSDLLPEGAIRFYLWSIDRRSVIADTSYRIYGPEGFKQVYLFTANLTPGAYILGIEIVSYGEFHGAIQLALFPDSADPSITRYYSLDDYTLKNLNYDIGWQAVCYTEDELVPEPRLVIKEVVPYGDKALVSFELFDFKPNTPVDIIYASAVYVEGEQTARRANITRVYTNNTGYYSGTIILNYVEKGDWLEAWGYDRSGTYIIVRSTEFEVTIKSSWLDVAFRIFNALFSYMHLAFSVVISLIPYASVFYMLSFIGVVIKCMNEVSILPLFDYFYRQYQILVNLSQLIIKIAEKLYEGTKTLIEWIIKIVDVIL